MAHESFENAEIAALMNRRFVNIKVDREERPDLDTIYQQALALMGQQGGWPLTMFLTPAGEPFWGGTYFPPEPRYGRPGFAAGAGAGGRALAQRQRARRRQPRRPSARRCAGSPRPSPASLLAAGTAERAARAAGRALRHDPWRPRRRAQVPAGARSCA